MSTTDEFSARLGEFVGLVAEPPRVARYAVNAAMIRNWVEAHEDENPVYVDAEIARLSDRPDLICPPAMISTWVMNGLRRYREVQRLRAEGISEDHAYSRLLAVLDEAGFTSVVATDVEQTYHRELVPGDRVRCEITIEAVSDFKYTGLGLGCWITLLKTYLDQHDELLVTERFKLLRFNPQKKKEKAPSTSSQTSAAAASSPGLDENAATMAPFATATVGTTLPELDIPLDRTTIVATAIASQDFEDVHHDPGKAAERGTADIFMSINSTNGFLDRYITDWTGPTGRIKEVSLRLGVPNFPGDVMRMTGEVVEADGDDVTVQVVGRNANGPHVTARIVVGRTEARTPPSI